MAETIPDHHFVSQALLRRFVNKAGVLQVYNVQTGVWNDLPPKQVFCYPGYNQLSAFGNVDNSLEVAFSQAETHLPKILTALDVAAQNATTPLSLDIYSKLCWYCALLWHISLAGKAKALVDFLMTINEDLKEGKVDLLRNVLGLPENDIQAIQKAHSEGKRVILKGQNCLQIIYKIQCVLRCKEYFDFFSHYTKWSVYNSPVELPISDIPLVQIGYTNLNATVYHLPISPNLLLVGVTPSGTHQRSDETLVYGKTLPPVEAQELADMISYSAQLMLASKNILPDISEMRKRGARTGVTFFRIANMQSLFAAGITHFNGVLEVILVDHNEYNKFIRSFIGSGPIYLFEGTPESS